MRNRWIGRQMGQKDSTFSNVRMERQMTLVRNTKREQTRKWVLGWGELLLCTGCYAYCIHIPYFTGNVIALL